MKVYIVNGYPRSGKDTFMDFCISELREKYSLNAMKVSAIDKVKELALNCGWNGIKDIKGRKFLSDLKDLLTDYDDIPFKHIIDVYNIAKKEDNNSIFFICCREPQEIQRLKEALNAKTIFVSRKDVENTKQINHADKDVELYEYDYFIENNSSLQELKYLTNDFIEYIILGENYDD